MTESVTQTCHVIHNYPFMKYITVILMHQQELENNILALARQKQPELRQVRVHSPTMEMIGAQWMNTGKQRSQNLSTCVIRIQLHCIVRIQLHCIVRIQLHCIVRIQLHCMVRIQLHCISQNPATLHSHNPATLHSKNPATLRNQNPATLH